MATDDDGGTGDDGTPLFARALGEDWADLHPKLRERYGVRASEDREAVGTGEMGRLSRSLLAWPVLWLGTREDFLFPEQGTDVPFSITTEAFRDGEGREALFLHRHFDTDPPRDFVDTLRWNPDRGCITDLFGRRGRVVSDLHLGVADGDLALSLGSQWLRVRGRYVRIPWPFEADGTLLDGYDEDAGEYRVAATIRTPVTGDVFAYEGAFENAFRAVESERTTDSALGDVALPGG